MLTRSRLALLCCLALSLPARAHSQSASPCDSAGAAYLHCGLMLEGGAIRRGVNRDLVAKAGFFSPMALSHAVQGDSARHYAELYERDYKHGNIEFLMSLAFLGGGFALVHDADRCHDFSGCGSSDAKGWTGVGLAGVGLLFEIHGLRTVSRSFNEAVRAVWWHNAGLGR